MNTLLKSFIRRLAVVVSSGCAIVAIVIVHQKNQELAKLGADLKKSESAVTYLTPKAARAWSMPVVVEKITDGRILVVNQSNAPLPVTFSVVGGKARSVVIPKPGGWLFSDAKPGDLVEVSSSGFDPILVRAVRKDT